MGRGKMKKYMTEWIVLVMTLCCALLCAVLLSCYTKASLVSKKDPLLFGATYMTMNNPFYEEANKVLSGKLEESDAEWRRVILNYCEHLRAAYTTKDIDFIKQVFSDNALIIVGSVVNAAPADDGYTPDKRVTYYLRTKKEYVSRLSKAFAANKKINVKFSDFRIMRHPTMKGIYGVSLRQCYTSDRYADDGWLFLLWDFRDRSMPRIHVRTWQPADDVKDGEIINIGDFNLQ